MRLPQRRALGGVGPFSHCLWPVGIVIWLICFLRVINRQLGGFTGTFKIKNNGRAFNRSNALTDKIHPLAFKFGFDAPSRSCTYLPTLKSNALQSGEEKISGILLLNADAPCRIRR